MAINIRRTNSSDPAFIELVKHLDTELAILDGEEHAFYNSLNKIDRIKYAVVAFEDERALSCGALRDFAPGVLEVKRMYTLPSHRGQGLATKILKELENWAVELGYTKCVLETGKRQPEAISLYTRNGYQRIPNYGQYLNIENSVCFEKQL